MAATGETLAIPDVFGQEMPLPGVEDALLGVKEASDPLVYSVRMAEAASREALEAEYDGADTAEVLALFDSGLAAIEGNDSRRQLVRADLLGTKGQALTRRLIRYDLEEPKIVEQARESFKGAGVIYLNQRQSSSQEPGARVFWHPKATLRSQQHAILEIMKGDIRIGREVALSGLWQALSSHSEIVGTNLGRYNFIARQVWRLGQLSTLATRVQFNPSAGRDEVQRQLALKLLS